MKNKELWDSVKRPPASALKTIRGGRLSGMSDIKPQWRYEIMTEQFGPCGVGWRYSDVKFWTVDGFDGEVFLKTTHLEERSRSGCFA